MASGTFACSQRYLHKIKDEKPTWVKALCLPVLTSQNVANVFSIRARQKPRVPKEMANNDDISGDGETDKDNTYWGADSSPLSKERQWGRCRHFVEFATYMHMWSKLAGAENKETSKTWDHQRALKLHFPSTNTSHDQLHKNAPRFFAVPTFCICPRPSQSTVLHTGSFLAGNLFKYLYI